MAASVIMMDLLGRGAHADPRRGSSILELASVLAGERWSTGPQSVHPALAAAAGPVNDLLSDDRRRLLVPLAPWLLGTNAAGERAWAAVGTVCGARVSPGDRRRARRAIRSALLSMAASRPDRADADEALCQVLAACINECRRLAGQPPADPRLRLAECPHRLGVQPHFVRSPGCDWTELGYRPVPHLLPACLQQPITSAR